jgi:hypothetical protein
MKHIIFCLLALGMFSCQSDGVKKKDGINKYGIDYAEVALRDTAAAKSNTPSDTVFLDFRFGMSKSQFNQHTNYLLRKGKFKTNYLNEVYYTFVAESGITHEATISVEYFEGKMYKLVLRIDQMGSLAFIDVGQIIEKKYGYPLMYKIDDDYYIQLWYRENLKIEMTNLIHMSRIEYIDMRVSSKVESENNRKSKEKLNETINDL